MAWARTTLTTGRHRRPLRSARGRETASGVLDQPPAVHLYGFEAQGRWASAMLHNRSPRPITDAAPLVVDDDRALVRRLDGRPLAAGGLVQLTFHTHDGVPPPPSRCFVEFTDAQGCPWVVGVDRPVPRTLDVHR